MISIPVSPKIYHITHIQNLSKIIANQGLVSDAKRIQSNLQCSLVGMSDIKQRRLKIEVSCHPGTKVGEYVPFYFCSRSIMLYILHKGNHPDLSYQGGQNPIVHLQSDVNSVIQWGNANGVKWSFTNTNASSGLVDFYKNSSDLSQIDWNAVNSNNFNNPQIKHGKQAEFLMFDFFPWTLVEKIGTINTAMATKVQASFLNTGHQPIVAVEQTWYF
jgi:hypothetical protein